jgi:DNA polymerase
MSVAEAQAELLAWVAAARGALRWHLEGGEGSLGVPDGFEWSAEPPPERAPDPAPPRPVQPTQRFDPPPVPVARAQRDLDTQRAALASLHARLDGCVRCPLSATRTRLQNGHGDVSARLAFVSDFPLVEGGEAAVLLERMVRAMGLSPDQVWMTALMRCRPHPERAPSGDEVATCAPFVVEELAAVGPEVIVALGALPTRALLSTQAGIRHLRGQWQRVPSLRDVELMPTFNPEMLIQNADLKRWVWDDLKKVMTRLGTSPKRAGA